MIHLHDSLSRDAKQVMGFFHRRIWRTTPSLRTRPKYSVSTNCDAVEFSNQPLLGLELLQSVLSLRFVDILSITSAQLCFAFRHKLIACSTSLGLEL